MDLRARGVDGASLAVWSEGASVTAGRRGAATTRSASEGAPASYVVRRTPVRGPSASCRTGRWRLRRAGGVRGCRLGGQRRRAGGLRLPLSGSAACGGRGRVSRNAPPPMVPVVVRRTRKALYVPPCSLGSRAGCMNPSGAGGGAPGDVTIFCSCILLYFLRDVQDVLGLVPLKNRREPPQSPLRFG